jgi:serine/threonine protein kinase
MTRIAEQGEPAAAPESAESNYVGLTIDDRYQVLRPLGSGGMGTVVLARHSGLRRLVAIKFLEQAQVSESGATQRLFREAQTAAAIGHPNIIDVLDVGVSPWGAPYLVMEFLEGEDLATFTDREGTLTNAEAIWVLECVLNGLGAAHETGVVHRDVKPQNVVLARKRSELTVKIIDFGIAKVSEPGLTPLTRSGELVGTPSFMSPEQAKGEEVDARSDIFSAGVLFHRLLAGKNPFSAANYHSLLHRIATGEPDLAALPSELRSFIERCLEKDPAKRFQTVSEALSALSTLPDWPSREQGRSSLAAKLHVVTTGPETVPDGSWTPSHDRVPNPSRLAPFTERSPSPTPNDPAAYLEPTLAASTSSSEALRPLPRPWQRWGVVALGVGVAFVGGWFAANWGDPAQPVSEATTSPNRGSNNPPTELQIGKDAVVKLFPAAPASTPSSEVTAPSDLATANPTTAASVRPASVVPAPKPSVASVPTAAPEASAPVPKPAGTLGKAGKNSFFSEEFE